MKVQKPKRERLRGFRNFLKEYRRYRFGTAGIVIIAFFAILALLAPVLTPYNPIYATNLSGSFSVPAWATVFPQYASLPRNAQILQAPTFDASGMSYWQTGEANTGTTSTTGSVNYTEGPNGLVVDLTPPQVTGIGTQNPEFILNQTFTYPWTYTCHYTSTITVTPLNQNLSTNDLTIQEYITGVTGKTYKVLDPTLYTSPADHFAYVTNFTQGVPTRIVTDSADSYSSLLATGTISPTNLGACGLPQGIFKHAGNATVSYFISSDVPLRLQVSSVTLNIQGQAFGVLGTDSLGRDVWSQFVYGAQISLAVGLIAALMAVTAGTLVGLAAGYFGGFVDEGLMRFTDFMLTLPFLPLLLILITIITVGHVRFPFGREFLIVVIIAVFSWEGIARIIRSQVLTIKSRQFVEASRALGAGSGHVTWKHILPNVMGLVYANMALTVPAAILTEAAVTFLGFGDPSVISWGAMVSNAETAVTSTIHSFAWWWFLPPGLAIAFLSMAFLFVGFALDDVLNPRLRRR